MAEPESHQPSAFAEADEVPERALRIYARLWQLESWLRRMVYVELRALLGDAWSKSFPAASKSFESDKFLSHMPTPEMSALSYSPLSKLTESVASHWECFAPYLPPQALWDAKLKEIAQIRHRIAHFRVGHADDYPRLLQFLRDIDKGFWTFCTTYNDSAPVLPQSADPVETHFLGLDPLPWVELESGQWARVGFVDKSPVIGMTVEVLTRAWATTPTPALEPSGHFYDFSLMAHDGRKIEYEKLLQRTRKIHDHVGHICLSAFEENVRITIPAVCGPGLIISLIEEFLDAARYSVTRLRSPTAPTADAIAAEWPEYVLGPRDPLAFLDPAMKCTFFNA